MRLIFGTNAILEIFSNSQSTATLLFRPRIKGIVPAATSVTNTKGQGSRESAKRMVVRCEDAHECLLEDERLVKHSGGDLNDAPVVCQHGRWRGCRRQRWARMCLLRFWVAGKSRERVRGGCDQCVEKVECWPRGSRRSGFGGPMSK